MSNIQEILSFRQLSTLLVESKAVLGPEEAHGIQTGLICYLKSGKVTEDWLQVLLRELDCSESENLTEALEELYTNTVQSLEENEFNFTPLLPEDQESMKERVWGLSSWCRGFLCGLALAGLENIHLDQSLVKEALQDLAEIAYRIEDDDESEETEKAYFQLVEYVRAAVQMIHIELKIQRILH